VPLLGQLVTNRTQDTLSLSNGVDLEVRASSFRGLRGITAVSAIADEIGFWYDSDSANADSEILAAIRPALGTTNGPLVCISSPHARRGELFETWKRHFGPDGDPRVLVVKAPTRELNPTFSQKNIDRALERDPSSGRSEYMAEFRSDLETYVRAEVIDAAIDDGVFERQPIDGVRYVGFNDPASGSGQDSWTAAVAHLEDRALILDAVLEKRPPFSPEDAAADICAMFKRYRVYDCCGDRFAGEFPRELFMRNGVRYWWLTRPPATTIATCCPN
jgi:hypothetical protein